jgi:hypothetical protein
MPLSRVHRKANMPIRSRTEFENQNEWTAYVRECVPLTQREYVLASGRTELFKSFYDVRKQEFPAEYIEELGRIETLSEPHRTDSLERLNERIFVGLSELLFQQSQPNRLEAAPLAAVSPKQQVQDLLNYLTERNPYFALWVGYKRGLAENSDAQSWDQFLRKELGPADEDAIVFAEAMADLDKLLLYFGDRNVSLPRYFFERVWFLHHLRGPERMVQTRTLLNTLTTETGECTSA